MKTQEKEPSEKEPTEKTNQIVVVTERLEDTKAYQDLYQAKVRAGLTATQAAAVTKAQIEHQTNKKS